ncbi:rCG35935 [Rattus norvegicus]|uniref:RCG35935 n=1 Tax=Rattus norvegicus TaxID=10116 RepID=A6IJQ1_RAT|nr:rCG35935 [Rattus norvegicus]
MRNHLIIKNVWEKQSLIDRPTPEKNNRLQNLPK